MLSSLTVNDLRAVITSRGGAAYSKGVKKDYVQRAYELLKEERSAPGRLDPSVSERAGDDLPPSPLPTPLSPDDEQLSTQLDAALQSAKYNLLQQAGRRRSIQANLGSEALQDALAASAAGGGPEDMRKLLQELKAGAAEVEDKAGASPVPLNVGDVVPEDIDDEELVRAALKVRCSRHAARAE